MDKYKLLRYAERLVAESKFSQAISEYDKVLQQDANDPTLLNTIGDLLVRTHNNPKALQYFQKVAEIYQGSGFALRAIATYKKIHGIEPANTEVNRKLADLFQKQGLNVDSVRHMGLLVDAYRSEGETRKALDWLRKAVDLSPDDPQIHFKLADTLSEEEPDQATDHWAQGVSLLIRQDQFEAARESCLQAMQDLPHNSKICSCYVDACEKLNRLDDAEKDLLKKLEDGGEDLPYRLTLAMIKERLGDPDEAGRIYADLRDKDLVDSAIGEGLRRTALESASPLPAAATETQESDQQSAEDQESDQQTVEDDESLTLPAIEGFELETPSSDSADEFVADKVDANPFHPAGMIEEVEIPENESLSEAAQEGSGLFLDGLTDEESPSPSEFSVTLDEPEQTEDEFDTGEFFEFTEAPSDTDGSSSDQETAPPTSPEEPVEAGQESGSPTPSFEDAVGEYAAESDGADDEMIVASLEEALEEADFYDKLGFQDEAKRVVKALVRQYPEDERVLRRAKKILGVVPTPSKKPPAQEEFEEQIDEALDSLFEAAETDGEVEEVLRYDVQRSSDARGENPKVHYDLGCAYREMGLLQDAVQEFLAAAKLLQDDEHLPQKILCCSTLANSYLQLQEYDEAIRWARTGLEIEDMKDFEWKALRHDLGCALELKGEKEEALEAFQSIAKRDKAYRDVPQRIERLMADV